MGAFRQKLRQVCRRSDERTTMLAVNLDADSCRCNRDEFDSNRGAVVLRARVYS